MCLHIAVLAQSKSTRGFEVPLMVLCRYLLARVSLRAEGVKGSGTITVRGLKDCLNQIEAVNACSKRPNAEPYQNPVRRLKMCHTRENSPGIATQMGRVDSPKPSIRPEGSGGRRAR